jgi:outer membrane receptor protein involved in Fe transport
MNGLLAFIALVPVLAQEPVQQKQDTIVSLEAVIVTAERTHTRLSASAASVSRLTRVELEGLSHVTLADALQRVPGFALVNLDGLGYMPQLMVRGFYGGGEAEYVVVLVDGKPINSLQSGVVPWDAIPLSGVARVEIVRGGSSALYGDAAVGGVINVITHDAAQRGGSVSLAGGTFEGWRGSGSVGTALLGRDLSIFGGFDRTDGFRSHAKRDIRHGGGSLALLSGSRGRLTLSGLGHWRDYDDPGPLLDSLLAEDRSRSDLVFRFDRVVDRKHRLGVDGDLDLTVGGKLSGSLTGEQRSVQSVRTLPLSTDFADTKERDLRTMQGSGTVQLDVRDTPLPLADQFSVGIDAAYGGLDSKYYNVRTGPRAAYASGSGARGALDASGAGERAMAALFFQYTLMPTAALRISLGARQDWLRDNYEPRNDDPNESPLVASHSAFSPKVGVNLGYVDRGEQKGNVYVSAGRSFKAPTLDQLFDQRRIPVAPGVSITTSNPLLDPQHGTSVEGGVYHRAALLSRRLTAELSLSAYQMDMRNELDFDIQTFRYVNIGKSRHRGLETGLKVSGAHVSSAFINYTLQNVTAESGQNSGNYLKAIPRQFFSGGFNVAPYRGLETGMVLSHTRDMYLDDANTRRLPSFTRVDAQLAHAFGPLHAFLAVRNLFDKEYSTTAFPDPAGSNAIYYYPAAGRVFEIGVRRIR